MMSQGKVVIGEAVGRADENLKRTWRRKRPERQGDDEVRDPERVPQKRKRSHAGAESRDRPGERQRGHANEHIAPARARRKRRGKAALGVENDESEPEHTDRMEGDERRQGHSGHRISHRG